MKISTYKDCLVAYTDGWSGWEKGFDAERNSCLEEFPYSIIVEGDTLEVNVAESYCVKYMGLPDITNDLIYAKDRSGELKEVERQTNGLWKNIFYGKTGYDYGFCEFFFKKEEDANKFRDAVEDFFIESPLGKKWKTNGYGNLINLS